MVISERGVVRVLAGVSVVLAVVALGLFASRPSVRARSTGETFSCLATWDIVLNDAYNDPDGFPALPGERIGERCVHKAHVEFRASLGAGTAAVAVALIAVVVRLRRRQHGPRQNTGAEDQVGR